MIVRDVERGLSGYQYETNKLTRDGEMRKVWSVYRGRKGMYNYHDKEAGGVTMVLHRPDSSTMYHTANLDGVVEDIISHENSFQKLVDLDEAKGKYLSSDKGAWGR